jgi:threonine/homoserine/homoserine lactone efflux protein
MLLLLHFGIGFITSFLGSLVPSMLNMTAAKISLNKGKKNAIKFAIGVSIIVFIQAYLATLFTRYLRENPSFVQSLQKIALVIFVLLSIYFYLQHKKDTQKRIDKKNNHLKKQAYKNTFIVGLLLSSLNMFSIPFYCGITTALDVAGWLYFSQTYILTFVIGSTIGTFMLLYMYLNFAKKIQSKSKGLSKNLNLILSILTGVLAIVTFFKIL